MPTTRERKKRKDAEPQSNTQILRDAIADLAGDQEKARRREEKHQRRQARRGRFAWLDRRILAVLGLALLVLIGDGIRRENAEFSARVLSCSGSVTVAAADGSSGAAEVGAKVAAGSRVVAGPNSKATLELHDGSRVIVTADSELRVVGLDYNRAGYRDHAFRVEQGAVMASVGDRFGADSELAVGTPGAVASVRGTTLFVRYDPAAGASYAGCKEGAVRLTRNGLRWQDVPAGTWSCVDGQGSFAAAQPTDEAMNAAFLAEGELALPPSKDPLMQRVEYGLNRALDPVLSIVGIGKCSWGVLAGDRARKEAARVAARDLHTYAEALTELPVWVDLGTLEGLSAPEMRRGQILAQIHGNRLEGYASNRNDYVLLIRAKDRAKSLFLVTRTGVEDVTKKPERAEAAIAALGV